MHLNIIYRDEHLIAIDKPVGLLVHKSFIDKHETQNAMHLLRDQIGQWVYPVHRLDKPTSGVLLFALNPDVAKEISQLFEAHQVHKTYRAIVRGHPPEQGVIDHPIKPSNDFKTKNNKSSKSTKPAQEALTEFKCLETFELPYSVDRYPTSRYALVELYPKTGRKHQLRKHLKHISHPIIGDPKYGKSKHNQFFQQHYECKRLLLASTALSFCHPIIQENITLSAPISGDFLSVSEVLSQQK
jgi:tRNA pseudouridine65 synthase